MKTTESDGLRGGEEPWSGYRGGRETGDWCPGVHGTILNQSTSFIFDTQGLMGLRIAVNYYTFILSDSN